MPFHCIDTLGFSTRRYHVFFHVGGCRQMFGVYYQKSPVVDISTVTSISKKLCIVFGCLQNSVCIMQNICLQNMQNILILGFFTIDLSVVVSLPA